MTAIFVTRDGDDPRAKALAAAKAQGCDCQPDVRLVQIEPDVHRAIVAHDDWCSLLRRLNGSRR